MDSMRKKTLKKISTTKRIHFSSKSNEWETPSELYNDLDHVLGSNKEKINDFLLCPIPHEIHLQVENGIEVKGYSFEERLLRAIEILIEDIIIGNKNLKN
jgi:hypothetical protein